jgi:hypothetical protein
MKKKSAKELKMREKAIKEMMRCPDCGVRAGRKHLLHCDQETCPTSGGQAISCTDHCYDPDGKPTKGFLRERRAYIGICELEVVDGFDLISHIVPLWKGGEHVQDNLHYVYSGTVWGRMFNCPDSDQLTEE